MLSIHCLQRGLLGYLIPFAPHAFVPERQNRSSKLLSHLVFLLILTDLTPTPAIPLASPGLYPNHLFRGLLIRSIDLTEDVFSRLRTLYAQ